jgi:plastocyanin
MKSLVLRVFLFTFATMLVMAACQPVTAVYEPRELTAWVGGGQDTAVVDAFLPETLHVRSGDTVTWQLDGDEIHTATFLSGAPFPSFVVPVSDDPQGNVMLNPQVAFPSRMPGAPVEVYDGANYANSGVMSHDPAGPDAPPNDNFSLTFSTPGIYKVHCIVHPWMTGLVVVHESSDPNAPSQTEIDAQAEAERAVHLADIEAARAQGNAMVRSEPAPDGSTVWHVRVGGLNVLNGNQKGMSFDFMPKDLTVKAGDTVLWSSAEFHTITFDPTPPAPEIFFPQPMEGGPPLLVLNPEVFVPAKPSPVYDPAQYYNSADIGPFAFNGSAWSLTFTEPGTYPYFCALHRQMGMEGTIIVE